MTEKTKISINQLAKRTAFSVEDLIKKFQASGLDVASGDDEVALEALRNLTKKQTMSLHQSTSSKPTLSLKKKIAKQPKPPVSEATIQKSEISNHDDLSKKPSTLAFSQDKQKNNSEKQKAKKNQESVVRKKQEDAEQHAEARMAAVLPSQPQHINIENREAVYHIPNIISVPDLAALLKTTTSMLVKEAFDRGIMLTQNQQLEQETAILLSLELGFNAQAKEEPKETTKIKAPSASSGKQINRFPVISIMGHVDHGKTSLLDFIRKTKVAQGEAGGITQHIGAYQVHLDKGTLTFIDTPGHAAFSAMRARGAQCTDIIVLVVAGDDGVKPQTLEVIELAKQAQMPVVVAINKIDKENIDIKRVQTELSQHGLTPEDWGGDTLMQPISALTGQGVDDLLETLNLQAEMLELKATIDCPAQAVVLESRIDRGLGPVATALVNHGTLAKGQVIIAGQEYGKIRQMRDYSGQIISSAGPSVPVEILGFNGMPSVGEKVYVVKNEKQAKQQAQNQKRTVRNTLAKHDINALFQKMNANAESKQINVVLKTDAHGSLEAIKDAIVQCRNDEVNIQVIAQGVGNINETDVTMANTNSAIIIGFNVKADAGAKKVMHQFPVVTHYASIIYDIIDYITLMVSRLTQPQVQEVTTGSAIVKQVFDSSSFGSVAGCQIKQGVIDRHSYARIIRDDQVIFEAKIDSLRRFKDMVKEVKAGMECGIGIKNFKDYAENDIIEAFKRETVKVN